MSLHDSKLRSIYTATTFPTTVEVIVRLVVGRFNNDLGTSLTYLEKATLSLAYDRLARIVTLRCGVLCDIAFWCVLCCVSISYLGNINEVILSLVQSSLSQNDEFCDLQERLRIVERSFESRRMSFESRP